MVHPQQRSNTTPTSASSCFRGFEEEDSSMEPQQEQAQTSRKKKVEWSTDLNSMEHPEPDHRSPMWDSETDHLLSYFLGDSSNGHSEPHHTTTHFETSGGSVENGGSGIGNGSIGVGVSVSHGHHSNGFPAWPTGGGSQAAAAAAAQPRPSMPMPGGAPRSVSSMPYDDGPVPPPTPQTQYYYSSSRSSSSSNSKPKKSSSSSPSSLFNVGNQGRNRSNSTDTLMKARAALLGGPSSSSVPMEEASAHMTDEFSPISPAAMIGSAEHEPLMLPPSPDKQYAFPGHPTSHHPAHNTTSNNNNHSNNKMHMSNPGHLEWLQQINAMAKASICNPAPPTTMHPHNNNNHHTIMPNTASAPTSHATMPQHHQQHPHPPIMATNPAVPPMAAHAIQQFSNGVAIPPHRAGDMLYAHLAQLQKATNTPMSEAESEEKRARRLERNRESARKSRRRKKERLTRLGDKVAALHSKLATERQKEINAMNQGLLHDNHEMLSKLNPDDVDLQEKFNDWMRATGPNCEVRRAVVDFQYSTLEQTLLPRYEKFLLWLTLHREDYFTKAKEVHSKREGKQLIRNSSGKISSKQVGEELTNGRKLENGKTVPPPQDKNGGDKSNPTAQAFDAMRMWPLLSFELSVSVDQEEKFMQAHKRTRQLEQLAKDGSQIAAATRMASKLKEAVLYQSHAAAVRSEKSYSNNGNILTPQQALAYQKWLAKNRERCKEKLLEKRQKADRIITTRSSSPSTSSPAAADAAASAAAEQEHLCLMDVCKKLEEVLKISHNEDDQEGEQEKNSIMEETN